MATEKKGKKDKKAAKAKAEVKKSSVEKKGPAKKKAPDLIRVQAVSSYMFEPFQRIAIPQGSGTPVERTNWVETQIKAGLLIEV